MEARSWVEALRAGEPAAFDRFYAAYRARTWSYLLRLARHRQLAEDLYQDVWVAIARGVCGLRPDTDLDAWVFTIARNRYRSFRRWALLDLTRLAELARFHAGPTPAGDPERHLDGSRALRRVEAALDALPEEQREILWLSGVEGLDGRRLGAVLGVTDVAARQRLSRARAALHAKLEANRDP